MENAPAERFQVTDRAWRRFAPPGYSHRRLDGAAIDYDLEKETEGFWLDHPDAAFAAFC